MDCEVGRLLNLADYFEPNDVSASEAIRQAAAEITRLRSQVERYREALDGIANAVRLGAESDLVAWANLATACQKTARTALETPEDSNGK